MLISTSTTESDAAGSKVPLSTKEKIATGNVSVPRT